MLGWEYPPFQTGGLAVHCYGLVHALARMGVAVDFYMPRTDHEVLAENHLVRIIPVTHVRFGAYVLKDVYGPEFFSDVHAFNNAAAEMVARADARRRYDLVHHHDWLTAFAAMKVKNTMGKPMVTTVHSTEYDRSAFGHNDYILEIERQMVANADRVITVSDYMRRRLIEKFGADERKLRVIYNAVDASEYKKRWEVRHGRERIVLFMGRLVEQKGPVQFLHAAKKVLEKERRVRFVISGTGDLLGKLIDLSMQLGIGEHVTFLGYLPEEQKRYVYAKSDVYVMPSVSEPFGITAVEAMASGTPVLLSKTSGAAEISPHVLTVDFWDVDAMAEKIIALLRYRVLSEYLGREELKDVMELTWDRVAEQTIGVYNEVIR